MNSGMQANSGLELDPYRQFRQKIAIAAQNAALEGSRSHRHAHHAMTPAENVLSGRDLIQAMRTRVVEEYMHGDHAPSDVPAIKRLLGIPVGVSLSPAGWWNGFARQVLALFAQASALQRLRTLLQGVRSYEGRQLVYRLQGRALLSKRIYFSESADWVLKHVDDLSSVEQWEQLNGIDLEVLKAGRSLGMSRASEFQDELRPRSRRLPNGMFALAVNMRVIECKQDLDHLDAPAFQRDDWREPLGGSLDELRRCIAVLRAAGLTGVEMIPLLRQPYWDADSLQQSLRQLGALGFGDLSGLFHKLESTLWRSRPKNWRYVLDVLDVRSVDGIAAQERLLLTDKLPPEAAIKLLRQEGFSQAEVERCQPVLCAACEVNDLLARLLVLVRGPWLMRGEHLVKCEAYLTRGTAADLDQHLCDLSSFGLVDPQVAIAFAKTFPDAKYLVRPLLSIGLPCRFDESDEALAEWIANTSQMTRFDRGALTYLVGALSVADFVSLKSATILSAVSESLLRFLVEQRYLNSLSKLKKWFSNHGRAASTLNCGDDRRAAVTALFADAYARENFHQIKDNYVSLISAVSSLCDEVVGPFPWAGDAFEREAYHAKIGLCKAKYFEEVAKHMGKILADGDGAVQRGFVIAACKGEQAYEEAKERLLPLLAEVMMGQGPEDGVLPALERDAIGQVYGVSSSLLESEWQKAIGLSNHLDGLTLQPCYAMTWAPLERVVCAPLDGAPLRALAQAGQIAQEYAVTLHRPGTRLVGLKSSAVGAREADLQSLKHHIAFMLALCHEVDVVASWLDGRLQGVSGQALDAQGAFELVQRLAELLQIALPDAIRDGAADHLLTQLSDAGAVELAAKLVPMNIGTVEKADVLDQPGPAVGGHERLLLAIGMCLRAIHEAAGKWQATEAAKFPAVDAPDALPVPMQAVVSKHGAAYFAKHACELCTRDRVEMWRESRHAHLLVFDPRRKRLVGMAMLYFQRVPEVHPSKSVLVLRGINPTVAVSGAYSDDSIIDGVIKVCIEIAEANGLAAVVLPEETGQHLLSNRDSLSKRLVKRYCQNSSLESFRRAGHHEGRASTEPIFEAYEQGNRSGAVDRLIVVWRAGVNETS